jgi:hypothetical protein
MPVLAWKVQTGSASARNSVVPKTTTSGPCEGEGQAEGEAAAVAFQHGCGERSIG